MTDLSGLERYRLAKPVRKLSHAQKIIERALNEVRIEDVLNDHFDIYVPRDAHSWKVRCPLSYEHEDGGLDKQFRVYSDNNRAYCFAMHGSFDTLSLWMLLNPDSRQRASEALLSAYGKTVTQDSYRDRIEAAQRHTEPLDPGPVVEAFNVFLNSHPRYAEVQYRQDVLHAVNSFLENVKQVCARATDMKEIDEWYQAERERLLTFLNSLT